MRVTELLMALFVTSRGNLRSRRAGHVWAGCTPFPRSDNQVGACESLPISTLLCTGCSYSYSLRLAGAYDAKVAPVSFGSITHLHMTCALFRCPIALRKHVRMERYCQAVKTPRCARQAKCQPAKSALHMSASNSCCGFCA